MTPFVARRSLLSRRNAAAAVLLVAIYLAVLPVPAAFDAPASPMDEGNLVVYPERVLEGDVPNRDFSHFYGPLHVWILAGSFAVAEHSVDVERAVGLVYRIGLLLAVFAICVSEGFALAIASALLAVVLLRPFGVAAIPWFLALALGLWGVWCLREARLRADRRFYLVGAVLCALAASVRYDLALAVALAAVVLVRRSGLRPLAIGGAIGLIPYAVLVWLAGPRAVLQNLILDGARERAGRRLPVPPLDADTRVVFWMVMLSLGVWLVAAVAARSSKDNSVLACALFGAGTLPQMLQRGDVWHILAAGCITLGMLPLALAALGSSAMPRLRVSVTQIGAVVATGLVALPVLAHTSSVVGAVIFESVAANHAGRMFPVWSREEAADLSALLTSVDEIAPAGARLFVGPRDLRRTNYNDTFLYFLLPALEPATFFLEMSPGNANGPGSRLASDIASADVLILTTRWDGWNEPNASREYGSDKPNRVVRDMFCLHEIFGPWELYSRCAAQSS